MLNIKIILFFLYWSEQHASWEQLMTFTDDKKASCTLVWQIFLPKLSSSVYCQNSSSSTPKEKFVQNVDKPLGFPLLLWDSCWEGWESWISFSDMKKRWFWWIFKSKKFNLFWHLPLYLRISQQLHWFSTIW